MIRRERRLMLESRLPHDDPLEKEIVTMVAELRDKSDAL
jgi:hypothetical protein